MRSVAAILLWFAAAGAAAGTEVQGLETYCSRDEFQITHFNAYDGKAERGRRASGAVYTDFTEHRLTCNVNGHAVTVEFQLYDPRSANECGARPPGGRITLGIDGETFLMQNDINACFDTLDSVRVLTYRAPSGTFALELCGRTNPNFMPMFEGCVTALRDDLKAVKKPLGRRFPVADLLKVVRF